MDDFWSLLDFKFIGILSWPCPGNGTGLGRCWQKPGPYRPQTHGVENHILRIGPKELSVFSARGGQSPNICRVLSTRWELHFQACREPFARLRLVGVLISIHILDSWPSNHPFWRLGQLDAELVQIVDQKCIGARFVIECGRTRSGCGSFLDPPQHAELTAPALEFVSACFS